MTIRLRAFAVAAFAGVFVFSGARASEAPYYKNVSDVEVETSVKGTTYDKALDKSPAAGLFGDEKRCANDGETKDGKAAAVPSDLNDRLKTAVAQLSTASWQDAQALLIQSGKASVPILIDALNSSDAAYNLGGHTKSDAGRLPRQRTVGEVAAELLTEIVSNHTSYKGELPGANQAAWRDWWSKNAEGVTFASN